jgi:enamine deaminase RidA (YjgF/YER057c/UK114 family)
MPQGPLVDMIAGAPDPVAPLSHAVEQEGWVFVNGQMPCSGTANDSPYPDGIDGPHSDESAKAQAVLRA